MKASNPDKEFWGWGMTANRSGDGETTVKNQSCCGAASSPTRRASLSCSTRTPYRQYAIAGLEYLKEIYTDPKYAKILPTGVNSWTDPSNNEAYLAGKIFFTNNAGTMFAKAVFDKNPVADDTLPDHCRRRAWAQVGASSRVAARPSAGSSSRAPRTARLPSS